MSKNISLKKLKRIMYNCLRYRLQLPEYIPHNEIPDDASLSAFSQGVKTAYRDLLGELDKIESVSNQRGVWKWRKGQGRPYKEEYIDEMRW